MVIESLLLAQPVFSLGKASGKGTRFVPSVETLILNILCQALTVPRCILRTECSEPGFCLFFKDCIIFTFSTFILCLCVVGGRGCCATAQVWKSEDNMKELVLPPTRCVSGIELGALGLEMLS